MRSIYLLILLSICSLRLLAQDLPNDFYVTLHGDTVYGRCIIGGKYIVLQKPKGEKVKLDPPTGNDLPELGFAVEDQGLIPPSTDYQGITITVNPESDRLQLLTPFTPWDGKDLFNLKLLIKARGKCTTDHISMAGPWLTYRGHLDNISNNLLIGAINDFNGKAN